MSWLRPVGCLRRACSRLYGMFSPIDLATGLEKRELLAHLAGNYDPYYILPIKKGQGTKKRPNLIPSANSYRIVACQCHNGANCLNYTCLHLGHPKRCYCGHWFQLYTVSPFVSNTGRCEFRYPTVAPHKFCPWVKNER
ncbi:cytochrome c oxidase subunit 5B, mitochondrial-like [Anticarsia gemmatalis]|uniref:cytochrome c oxidase subunit 5B, mitochondrial-like n=1 Tax=Anticarsia gemmatalis TaxID=129554 RepID=UPI003F76A439